MIYDPAKHHRQSIRFKEYDYTRAGAYFVTICTQKKACLFGEVLNDEVRLNSAGRVEQTAWDELPARFPCVCQDAFVVMPNHVHGIIMVGAPLVGAQKETPGDKAITNGATTRVAPTVGDIIGAFKSITTNEYITGVKTVSWSPFPGRLWQRNYYEHIIRDDASLDRIRLYIFNNPLRWDFDRENPKVTTPEPENAWLT